MYTRAQLEPLLEYADEKEAKKIRATLDNECNMKRAAEVQGIEVIERCK